MEDYPIFDRILADGSDVEEKTLAFVLGLPDGTGARFDIKLGVVGPLSALLAAHAQKIIAAGPEGDGSESAGLNAKSVFLSASEQGEICITFELQSGVLLPLQCNGDALSGLAAELTLLSAGKGRPSN